MSVQAPVISHWGGVAAPTNSRLHLPPADFEQLSIFTPYLLPICETSTQARTCPTLSKHVTLCRLRAGSAKATRRDAPRSAESKKVTRPRPRLLLAGSNVHNEYWKLEVTHETRPLDIDPILCSTPSLLAR